MVEYSKPLIDNFEVIRSHLTFESQFDRYIVHILKRAKDEAGRAYGVNETNRLIKTFFITSLEYFDKKKPVIEDLCITNNARAYILPQVRNNEDCLKELLKVVVDNLSNPSIKPDHLIRTAYCGYHGSRSKKWILDLDSDNMTEYYHSKVSKSPANIESKEWKPEEVLEFVQRELMACGKKPEEAYLLPTKSGYCIVTSPFDLQKAFQRCNMFFQGEARRVVGWKWTGPCEGEEVHKKVHGWVIKDGMALLYMWQGAKRVKV